MGQPTRDQALEFRVSKFLQSRHFPGFDELNVQVEEGCVYITGQLNSYYEKQVAINSCRRVA
ncbi:MAG: BON domain-containing protein, partial [Planctomycetota bacterium]